MGWIIALGVAALLALLLVVPVTLHLRYEGDFSARASYLFLRFPLYPPRQKKDAPKAKKAAKPKAAKKEKPKKGTAVDRFFSTLTLMIDMIEPFCRQLGRLCRHIRIDDLVLSMRVTGADAGDAGIRYGQAQRNLWAVYALARNLFTVGRCNIRLHPDFFGAEGEVRFRCKLRLAPWVPLAAFIRLAWPLLLSASRRGKRTAKAG